MKPTTLHFAALGAAATLACATSAPVIAQAATPGKAQQPPRALPAGEFIERNIYRWTR